MTRLFYFCLTFVEQDLLLPESSFLFGSGAGVSCQNLTIINDGVKEDMNENLTLSLHAENPNVVLMPNEAQVIIIDNDSKFFFSHFQQFEVVLIFFIDFCYSYCC